MFQNLHPHSFWQRRGTGVNSLWGLCLTVPHDPASIHAIQRTAWLLKKTLPYRQGFVVQGKTSLPDTSCQAQLQGSNPYKLQTQWQRNQLSRVHHVHRSSNLGWFVVASSVAKSAVLCAISVFAVSVSENLLTKARFQAFANHHGKRPNRRLYTAPQRRQHGEERVSHYAVLEPQVRYRE